MGHLREVRSRVGGMDQSVGVAAGVVGPGPMWGQGNAPERPTVTFMLAQVQGLWYYILAEVIFHPFWLKCEYKDAIDPKEPRAVVRGLIQFVQGRIKQAQLKIRRFKDPYLARKHPFTTLCGKLGGRIEETLEPYIEDMEVTMFIDMYLSPPSHHMPTSIFDNWSKNREKDVRGCTRHMDLIRATFQMQASSHTNDWTPATVQQMNQKFTEYIVEIRSPAFYEDAYLLAHHLSYAYLWKVIEGRAKHIREVLEINLPCFRYIGIPMNQHYDEDLLERSMT
ncbi:MAG: hypothetical protein GY820_08500, partial [Gammaproteobacteria bacterium]|nr:hypothetical protein [Gammaproteobacteria bacterium]